MVNIYRFNFNQKSEPIVILRSFVGRSGLLRMTGCALIYLILMFNNTLFADEEKKASFSSLDGGKSSFSSLTDAPKDATSTGSGMPGGKEFDENMLKAMMANQKSGPNPGQMPMDPNEAQNVEMLLKAKAQLEAIKAQHDKQMKELFDEG